MYDPTHGIPPHYNTSTSTAFAFKPTGNPLLILYTTLAVLFGGFGLDTPPETSYHYQESRDKESQSTTLRYLDVVPDHSPSVSRPHPLRRELATAQHFPGRQLVVSLLN
jgi:hypothetical protein